MFQGGVQRKIRTGESLGRFKVTFACAFQISLEDMSGCSKGCNVTCKYTLKEKPWCSGQQEAASSGTGALDCTLNRIKQPWCPTAPHCSSPGGDLERRICFAYYTFKTMLWGIQSQLLWSSSEVSLINPKYRNVNK